MTIGIAYAGLSDRAGAVVPDLSTLDSGRGTLPIGVSARSVPALLHRGPAELIGLQQGFHGATSVSELFSMASNLARAECGFETAVVLAVESQCLTADRLHQLDDLLSDALRRRILSAPVPVEAGSFEAEFLRMIGRGSGRSGRSHNFSVLKERYGLSNVGLGAIAPRGDVIALLVVDRPDRPVTGPEQVLIQGFCQLVTYSVERLVLSQRMAELRAEMRYMMSSCQALLTEVTEAPFSLPVDLASGPVFAKTVEPALPSASGLRDLLTPRELSIAKEVIAGKSNREIALALHISPDTVKQYVSRVMRKLGASNRAEAAVRCMQLGETAA